MEELHKADWPFVMSTYDMHSRDDKVISLVSLGFLNGVYYIFMEGLWIVKQFCKEWRTQDHNP